ncbi:S1C family serine protease [Qipengyuania sp. MTN3-11]|uniref:S1C family serine protease n=1 Tax=Qipengyuania sp. MTN3-11 TaxID=3056557 RepID=UPI0036F38113
MGRLRIPELAVNVGRAVMRAAMVRFLALIATLWALAFAGLAKAEPADIDAAARGVVRVIVIGTEGEEVYPVSHGTGFAVSQGRIVTNAHVVRDAVRDGALRIGIVPSDGGEAVEGRIVALSPRNDLALIAIEGDLRLPPLTLASGAAGDSGEVYSVGYPMNVDRAQGLGAGDIFQAQPPVKSRGFLSGTRPSREFDTVLHTAPIARGNSGGPLLDGCGRVLGVNSFGADSGGSDAEFYFAVSNRELLPFLRANGIEPRVNDTACRSLADLEEEERARLEAEQERARANLADRSEAQRERRDRARFEAEMQVRDERDDRMLATMLMLLVAAGLAWWAVEKRERPVPDEDGVAATGLAGWPQRNRIVAVAAIAVLLAALMLHITRPGIDEIDRRVANAMGEGEDTAGDTAGGDDATAGDPATRSYVCTIDPQRSRITSAQTGDITFEWSPGGCVNGRTQYGYAAGSWSRVLVPNDEQAVSVNSFDPDREVFRTERYLLGREAMAEARDARGDYAAPSCEAEDASASLGERQSAVLATLPSNPNERLVYDCRVTEGG